MSSVGFSFFINIFLLKKITGVTVSLFYKLFVETIHRNMLEGKNAWQSYLWYNYIVHLLQGYVSFMFT